ncbi:hypothetical protein Scep_025927 [Stephania cephalantha]|uniref:Uncharacterized protein n=1 Tax=Stephania cephalantha TaxID=152367 RepID=A0AAP0EPR6_9MAGN
MHTAHTVTQNREAERKKKERRGGGEGGTLREGEEEVETSTVEVSRCFCCCWCVDRGGREGSSAMEAEPRSGWRWQGCLPLPSSPPGLGWIVTPTQTRKKKKKKNKQTRDGSVKKKEMGWGRGARTAQLGWAGPGPTGPDPGGSEPGQADPGGPGLTRSRDPPLY